MYAIVASGGKQLRVHAGDLITVEQRPGAIGDQITFDQVLVVGDVDEKPLQLGQPLLKDARVVGTITEQGKGNKVRVFRFKRRKRYRKLYGHRQTYTQVKIETIELEGTAKPKATKRKTAPSEATAKSPKVAAAPATKKSEPATKSPKATTPAQATKTKKEATKKTAAAPAQTTKKTTRKSSPKKTAAKAPSSADKTKKKATKKTQAGAKKTTKKDK